VTTTPVRILHATGSGMPYVAIPDLLALVANRLADRDCAGLAELHEVLVELLTGAIERAAGE